MMDFDLTADDEGRQNSDSDFTFRQGLSPLVFHHVSCRSYKQI